MKKVAFTKMSGAGNDFLIMDAPKGVNLKQLAQKACDRTNGIGADGIITLDKSKKYDYKMRIINADGSEAEMCGNGARCLAAYIIKNKNPKKKLFSLDTLSGEVLGESKGDLTRIRLSDPKNYKPEISLSIQGRKIHVNYIDTGVPHTIIFVDSLDKINVQKIGGLIRFHKKFKPRGTNVNFVEQINNGLVSVRTYERGVENETKACGTGSVAAAIVTYLKANPLVKNKTNAKMKAQTTGGDILEVSFDINDKEVKNVWLKGPVHFIAKGEYYA